MIFFLCLDKRLVCVHFQMTTTHDDDDDDDDDGGGGSGGCARRLHTSVFPLVLFTKPSRSAPSRSF